MKTVETREENRIRKNLIDAISEMLLDLPVDTLRKIYISVSIWAGKCRRTKQKARTVKNSVLAFFICLPTISRKSSQALLQKSADTHRVAAP